MKAFWICPASRTLVLTPTSPEGSPCPKRVVERLSHGKEGPRVISILEKMGHGGE